MKPTDCNRAHKHFENHVLPTIEEWRAEPLDLRRAMQAAVAVNQMADHYWHAYSPSEPDRVFNEDTVQGFRGRLAREYPTFGLIRDVAEAHKHVKLNRQSRVLTSAGQTDIGELGWGEAEYGEATWGSAPEIVVELDDGTRRDFSGALEDTVGMWERLLA